VRTPSARYGELGSNAVGMAEARLAAQGMLNRLGGWRAGVRASCIDKTGERGTVASRLIADRLRVVQSCTTC